MLYESFSQEDTFKIAYNIAKNSNKNDIFCLSGDLGVGKTVFAKGFAKGLGIDDDIISPTFTIVIEYPEVPFYHFDVYRLSSSDDMYDLGYEEYFYSGGICLIEWAEIVKDVIPENAHWIKISKDYSKDEDYRKIEVDYDNSIN